MEMMVIAVVVLLAFAGALVPLMRRRSDGADAAEFDAGTVRSAEPPASGDEIDDPHEAASMGVGPMAAGPATPVADTTDEPRPAPSADEVELEIRRYRAAVRAGTVCRKCGQANPAESVFCFECGARLPGADVKEFE